LDFIDQMVKVKEEREIEADENLSLSMHELDSCSTVRDANMIFNGISFSSE